MYTSAAYGYKRKYRCTLGFAPMFACIKYMFCETLPLKGGVFLNFTADYRENLRLLDEILQPSESFDIIKRRLVIGQNELS